MRVRYFYEEPDYRLNKATAEVVFGEINTRPNESGQPEYSMTMHWYDLSQDHPQAAKLEAFHDTFFALEALEDVWRDLGKRPQYPSFTPAEFCTFLREHGFQELNINKMPTGDLFEGYCALLRTLEPASV